MDAVLVRRCHGSRALDTFTTDLHEVGEEDVEEWQEEDSAEAQGQGDIGDQRRPGAGHDDRKCSVLCTGSSSTEVNKLVTTISILTVEE